MKHIARDLKPSRRPEPSVRTLDDRRLREVRGGVEWTWNDGGKTAGDDWEARA